MEKIDSNLDFNVWRKRASYLLPELSKRVFDLRGKMYKGCGFHWSLEKSLGACIKDISNYDETVDIGCQIAIQVCFESLIEKVLKIESELNPQPNESN